MNYTLSQSLHGFYLLRLLIQRVHDRVQVLKRRIRVLKHGRGLRLLEDDQAATSLVQRAVDHLVQNHLGEFLLHVGQAEADRFRDVLDLHLGVGPDDLEQVPL